jgi:hypothetical protein
MPPEIAVGLDRREVLKTMMGDFLTPPSGRNMGFDR